MNSQTIVDYIIKNKEKVSLQSIFDYAHKFDLDYLLPDVLSKIKRYNNREIKNSTVVLETSVNADEDTLKALENRYDLKIEKNQINKNIIAGYKIYSRDSIVDASIETLLKNFNN
ncbi:MAG: synthase delta subunit [Patescibacteria group bacterium]|nr:synthase delta subunit [Patescibacteria group bacterium]